MATVLHGTGVDNEFKWEKDTVCSVCACVCVCVCVWGIQWGIKTEEGDPKSVATVAADDVWENGWRSRTEAENNVIEMSYLCYVLIEMSSSCKTLGENYKFMFAISEKV